MSNVFPQVNNHECQGKKSAQALMDEVTQIPYDENLIHELLNKIRAAEILALSVLFYL